MNSRQINLVLGAIVVGLLGTIFFMVSWAKDRQTPEVVDRTNYVGNTVTQITVKKFNATNLLAALANRTLNWSDIESTNYFHYMLNLRSIGCPEETIRDIILADVAKLYARKREEILNQAPPPEYWRTVKSSADYYDPYTRDELWALEVEKRQLIKDLLGVNYEVEIAKFDSAYEPVNRLRGVFPSETRRQIQAVLDSYQRMEEEIRARGEGLLLPEDQAELRDLALRREAELSQILTPEQMQTFELYMSPLAEEMRRELYGFEPSASEFVEIYKLRKGFEEIIDSTLNDANYNLGPELRDQALAEAEAAFQEEMNAILGKDRFAEYERVTDPNYQQLLRLNERLQLPPDVVDQAYALQQSAERQKRNILANPNLTMEQRQNAVAAIARAAENVLSKVMGRDVFATYQQVGGDWFAELGEVPAGLEASTTPEPPVPQLPPMPEVRQPRLGDPVPPNAPFPFYQPPIIPPPPPMPNPVPQ